MLISNRKTFSIVEEEEEEDGISLGWAFGDKYNMNGKSKEVMLTTTVLVLRKSRVLI